jgi:erythronate-4-phosphate dehydrogenase
LKKKIKIIADNKIPFIKGALEPFADVIYLPGKEISPDHISDADALIIRTRTKCNEDLLEGSKVRFIASATIGFDHIDTQYCQLKNIVWANAPGCNSSSVEQYVLSSLINISRKRKFNLAGSTIGIVGVGHVGTKIKRIAKILGMNILLNDPPRQRNEGGSEFVSLEKIKNYADIISFHVPLTMTGEDRTFHLVDKKFLNSLGKRVHLINTSRGEVVDQNALKEFITNDKSGAVILDVWENEPFIDSDLLEKTEIATPHIAGYSLDGKANGTQMSVRSLSSFFNLGLESWSVDSLPVPEECRINIDAEERSSESIISEVVLRTYNVMDDDANFRKSPGSFEEQRENYHPRREAGAFTVQLKNDKDNVKDVISRLGFKVG